MIDQILNKYLHFYDSLKAIPVLFIHLNEMNGENQTRLTYFRMKINRIYGIFAQTGGAKRWWRRRNIKKFHVDWDVNRCTIATIAKAEAEAEAKALAKKKKKEKEEDFRMY